MGHALRPVREEWTTRFSLDWFPLDTTGWNNVRFVAPGTQLQVGPGGVGRSRVDVISGWVHPDPMTPADCLELARSSVLETEPETFEEHLIQKLLKGAPQALREEHRETISDAIRDAYRAADSYGLHGLERLHFFFLHEYTRRWASAAVSAQAGLVCAPILNPGFIRAAYAYPAREL